MPYMPLDNKIQSVMKVSSRTVFIRYLWLVLGLFLFVGATNFYQILMVAPDTVGMKAFKSAMFSSPGFVRDLLWFLGAAIFVHLLLVLLLWLGTVGWLANPTMRERQRIITIYFSFAVVCAWIMILSARAYPNMPSGFIKHNPLLMADITLYALSAMIALSFAVSLYRLCNSKWAKSLAATMIFGAVAGLFWVNGVSETQAKISPWANNSRPNILVIGVDSLRPDETGYFGSDGQLTPNIDEFLKQSTVYRNAYTPYARTFPAWMSILTGKEPVNHKGRFNLINHSYLDSSQTLAWWMKDRGYRTVYGFDERRFNNIDASFGFDAVVGPKPGAMGFVLGQYDHPMINLLSNTIVGKYLFPEMFLNRGRAGNYDPERYNRALLDEIIAEPGKPLFLSAHFLLPHFPWFSRDLEELEKFEIPKEPADKFAYQYRMMLKQVDRQFGQFMEQLQASGVLDNAQVILLSDHGDGFAFEKDLLTPARDDFPFEVDTNTRGHATNILNLGQYRVLLAGRSYGNDVFKPGLVDGNASLMDIVPTVFDLLDSPLKDKKIEGVSLLSSDKKERDTRNLFLESGFKTLSVTADDMTEEKLLREGIKAYTVNDDGKLVVRDVWYNPIIRSKHRAVIRGNWQLSMIPGMGEHMVVTNIQEKKWWPFAQYQGDAATEEMLAALCSHYKGEPGFDEAGVCLH
ncbi:MAG: DUF229 domain-containing protein [Gammaproteobacteria bacterium]|nr:MAG: DUF229 domain-containing protein [Gammaproteobacteria bacterium]